jgi:hypothetical protein
MLSRAGIPAKASRIYNATTGKCGLSVVVEFAPEKLGGTSFMTLNRIPALSFEFTTRGQLRDLTAWNELIHKIG